MQDNQHVFEGLTVIGSLIAAILFMMVTLLLGGWLIYLVWTYKS